MLNSNIIILVSENQILNYTAHQLGNGYLQLGYQVHYMSIEQIVSNPEELLYIALRGLSKVILINNRGWLLKAEGEYLWDKLKIPCINYVLDHPYFYFDTCDIAPDYGILACVDRNHVAYAKRFYPKIKNAVFLPLGGEDVHNGNNKAWQQRSIDVLYIGAYKGREDFIFDEFANEIIEILTNNTSMTYEDAVELCYTQSAMEISDEIIKATIEEYRMIDIFMKFTYRSQAVEQLVKAGNDVTVYGHGWTNSDLLQYPNFHYGGSVTQLECLAKIQDCKILLNIMPWFKDGIHDRVINAMLAGAISLTDTSLYLENNFVEGRDYVRFDLQNIQELPNIVSNILSHPQESEQLASAPYRQAREYHTWIQRAMQLEDCCRKI